jgi:Holliday junction resolvase
MEVAMINKKVGNSFEAELCEILSGYGFWCHNLAQNSAGQPADVIAARNGKAYLIDCKVCSTDKGFALSRVEENQDLAMELWNECGNAQGWFAMKLPTGDIIMLPHLVVKAWHFNHSYLTPSEIFEMGISIEKWVSKCP